LASVFELIGLALGLARVSVANVPLGREVLGWVVAGLANTVYVVPCMYSLLVPQKLDTGNDAVISPIPPAEPLPVAGETVSPGDVVLLTPPDQTP
jgi:hypothetical protein